MARLCRKTLLLVLIANVCLAVYHCAAVKCDGFAVMANRCRTQRYATANKESRPTTGFDSHEAFVIPFPAIAFTGAGPWVRSHCRRAARISACGLPARIAL